MRVVAFRPEHVAALTNYGGQEHLVGHVDGAELGELAEHGVAFTSMAGDRVIACGGLIEATKFRATAWALMARTTPQQFVAVHRAVWRVIHGCDYVRVEAYVDHKFPAAMRWVAMLGFRLERVYTPLFFPDGSGASQWVLYPKG